MLLGRGQRAARDGKCLADLVFRIANVEGRARGRGTVGKKRRQAAAVLGRGAQLLSRGARGCIERILCVASRCERDTATRDEGVLPALDAGELASSHIELALCGRKIPCPSGCVAAGEGTDRAGRALCALFGVREARRTETELRAQVFALGGE
jgi:hypothetical protein